MESAGSLTTVHCGNFLHSTATITAVIVNGQHLLYYYNGIYVYTVFQVTINGSLNTVRLVCSDDVHMTCVSVLVAFHQPVM